jgi:hypothetical protein
MYQIGMVMIDKIKARILSAKDITDGSAKPLTPAYAKWKQRQYTGLSKKGLSIVRPGRSGVRDWFLSGGTLNSFGVKRCTENQVVIGFTNSRANLVAHIQQGMCQMFGVSPSDAETLHEVVRGVLTTGNPSAASPVSWLKRSRAA